MHIKFVLAFIGAIGCMTASSGAGAWELIGTKNVTDRVDFDILRAPGPRLYNKIRICVSRNPVHFYDVDVHFANFGHQDIKIAKRINVGRCTRVIDLKSGKRDITYVKFLYEETSLKSRRATVSLYGR